ncbi:DUF4244 domain-containing protein [Streptomyces sp. NPDC006610]|jgi:hypothetical protein|uniref:DUF4244 domain-containing protein n=1 Tax=Streptomyces sp. NPDC006610 TaxID=3154584 RepID=UPI0033A2684B
MNQANRMNHMKQVTRAVQAVRAWARALVCGTRGVRREAGMVTSEYAVGIVAAVAFAAILYKVITSGQVNAELQAIVKRALDARM